MPEQADQQVADHDRVGQVALGVVRMQRHVADVLVAVPER
jgi:hypothetical protein